MAESTEMMCPYCGATQFDTWEYGDGKEGDFTARCDDCRKAFYFNRRIEVWFTTTKRRKSA